MGFFTDFKAINKVVFKKSTKSYGKNLLMIPILAVYVLIYVAMTLLLVSVLGLLGRPGQFIAGLMVWMLSCALMSDFLGHLDNSLVGRKLSFSNIGKHYRTYFLQMLSVTAIPNILIYVFYMFTRIEISMYLVYIVYALFATPEVVYQKNIDRLDIFIYGYHYFKENWMHWLPLNVIFALFIFGVKLVIDQYVAIPLIGKLFISTALPQEMKYLILILIQWSVIAIPFVFVMIYRGYLFKILSVSSARKREYMRNIYGK